MTQPQPRWRTITLPNGRKVKVAVIRKTPKTKPPADKV